MEIGGSGYGGFRYFFILRTYTVGNRLILFSSKKPQSFWTGGKAPNVNDIKKWNYALGKLFSTYGISIILTAFASLFPLNDTLRTVLVLVFPVGGVAIMILLYIKIIEPK